MLKIQYADEEAESLLASSLQKPQEPKKEQKIEQPQTPTPGELPKQIVHKVIYGDTLEGLSLEYSVPIGKIKYRNHIDGDAIYHLKEIIIPDPQCIPEDKEKTEDLLIEEFMGHMDYSEKQRKVARYYLLDADWQLEKALQEYRQDLDWQKKNKAKIKTQPLIVSKEGIELQQIRRYYDKQELLKKKTN